MIPAAPDSITPRPSRRPAALLTLLALCLALLAPSGARALELGALHVESSLGEPLRAEVDIVSTERRDLSGVRASLANVATYERFGVPRTTILSAIEVSVESKGDGEGVVRIRSREPVHDLFLSVLLAIDDRGTRLIREVAILLDPSAAAFARRRSGGESATTGTGTSSRTVYTVEPGDSLMRIAQRLAPPSTSPEQTAVALYEANPEAFLGSIHRLIVGARLNVPSVRTIRGYPPRVARRVIRNGIERFRQRLSGTTPDATRREEDGTRRAAASIDEIRRVEGSSADIASRPFGDELPLQDVQAVIVNLQGGLHDLQGTLDERIEQLDRLHARVDELIGERDALRERVERQARREAEARAAAAMAAAAAMTAAESVDLVDLVEPIEASPGAEATRVVDTPADAPERADPHRLAGTDAVSPTAAIHGTAGAGASGDAVAESFPSASNAAADEMADGTTDARGSRAFDGERPAAAIGSGEGLRTRRANDAGEAIGATGTDVPATRRSIGGDGTITGDRVPLATPVAAASDRTDGSAWNLARTMQAVRDGGLILLALCMVYVLFSRRFRPAGASEADEPQGVIFDPDADFEFYIHQPTDPYTKAQLLRSVLENSPQRQDMRLRLLELYASHGMTSLFAEEAQIMYRMTGGRTAEWHRAVALGLELDADIDFYKVLGEDTPFDPELSLGLSDQELVASVPGGTHVDRGRDASEGILSFEELEALHNSVAPSEDGALFTETSDAATSASDGAAASVTPASTPSEAGGTPDDIDATDTPPTSAAARVPLDERPVYVPEDEQELIAISVNYVYGVHRLDVDLDGDDDEAAEDERETNLDAALESYLDEAFDESSDMGWIGSDTAVSDVLPANGPGSDDESFLVEFLDGDPPAATAPGIADDDLLIDVEFPTNDVRLTLNLAETYVDNDHGDEARALIDAVMPRADADQRHRADALLERLAGPRPSELAVG